MKSIIALIVFIITFNVTFANACACSGEGSSDLDGNSSLEYGFCDQCPNCNSCLQLFSGCLWNVLKTDIYFEPTVSQKFSRGIAIESSTLLSLSEQSDSFTSLCVFPTLPAGLQIAQNTSKHFILSGTPTETLFLTDFYIFVKGMSGYVGRTHLKLSIHNSYVPSSTILSTPTPFRARTTFTCFPGSQRCFNETAFETCIQNSENIWRYNVTLKCAPGTRCDQNGRNIVCK